MSASSFNKKFDLEMLKQKGLLKRASQIKAKKFEKPSSLKAVFPEGEFIDTPFKQVFKVEKVYSPETRVGITKINDIFRFSANFKQFFSILGKNENLERFQLNKLLFLDVESTGLTSGAGNMVFLIVLGFFDKEKEFVVQQYFIEEYINKKGLLYILKDIFKEKYHLVSYNGRSFDFHILENRFILSRRFEFALDNLLHFDLLHSSRRMWKNMFAENTLNNLEKTVLKFVRTSIDIPGYLVPEYYKDYLKTGNAKIMESIFYHNLMDVRSMLGLLIIQMNNLQSVLNGLFPEDINLNSMASLVYGIDKDLSIRMLRHNCEKAPDKCSTLKQLYLYYKKDNDKDKFQEILQRMIDENKKFNYFPYCELSKYCEHSLKEPEKAIKILDDARMRMDNLMKFHDADFTKEIDDLTKRMDRLQKKCLEK